MALSDELREYTAANRLAFNEAAPYHRKAKGNSLIEKFSQPGYSVLSAVETELLRALPVEGRRVAQLCCNDGQDLLSIFSLGAVSGVGFDISDMAVQDARELAEVSRCNAVFRQSDVYDIGQEYAGQFDLVYLSGGSLPWLPDLEKAFKIIGGLLAREGILFIREMHPILEVFSAEDDPRFDEKNPAAVAYSYFESKPLVLAGLDYVGHTKYAASPYYWFTHKLSDILNSVCGSGLRLTRFLEFDTDVSLVYKSLAAMQRLPLSYILMAEK